MWSLIIITINTDVGCLLTAVSMPWGSLYMLQLDCMLITCNMHVDNMLLPGAALWLPCCLSGIGTVFVCLFIRFNHRTLFGWMWLLWHVFHTTAKMDYACWCAIGLLAVFSNACLVGHFHDRVTCCSLLYLSVSFVWSQRLHCKHMGTIKFYY